jgi:hypothetical protein
MEKRKQAELFEKYLDDLSELFYSPTLVSREGVIKELSELISRLNYKLCPICHTVRSYSEEWDSFYCKGCNKWLEEKCEDTNCRFCGSRPEVPNEDT